MPRGLRYRASLRLLGRQFGSELGTAERTGYRIVCSRSRFSRKEREGQSKGDTLSNLLNEKYLGVGIEILELGIFGVLVLQNLYLSLRLGNAFVALSK